VGHKKEPTCFCP